MMLNEDYVNWFSLEGRSYKVIPQVERTARNIIGDIEDYHVRTSSGELVPLSTLVTGFEGFVALRFVAGFAAGGLVSLSFAAIGLTGVGVVALDQLRCSRGVPGFNGVSS